MSYWKNWLLNALHKTVFAQHLILIYSWETVYTFSLGHQLHHDITFTYTDLQGSQEETKESSEDETKSQNTKHNRNVMRTTGAQVSEGNYTHIMLTQLHLLPPFSHHFPFCCCWHFPFWSFILQYATPTSVRWSNSQGKYFVNLSSAI